jgi:putative ABC transport system ATP-binding protein
LRDGEISETPIPFGDPLPAATPRRLVARVMWRTWRFALPAAAGSVVHQICEAMVPVIMGMAIDTAVVDGDVSGLIMWLALLTVNFVLLAQAARFGGWFGHLGVESMQHHLRTKVTDRLLHPRARADRLPGSALSLATNDVRHVAGAAVLLMYPVGELAAIVVGGTLLLLQSVPLGVAVLVGAPLLLFVLDVAGRPLRSRAEAEAAAIADASGVAADLLAGHRVVAGIHAQAVAADRYAQLSQRALRATMHARAAQGGLSAGLGMFTGLFMVAVATAAGLLAVDGELSVGGLITVVGLTQLLIGPISSFARNVAPIWSAAQASAARLLIVLTDGDTGTNAAAEVAERTPQPVRVENVDLGDGTALTMLVEPGEIVGVPVDGVPATVLAETLAARRRMGEDAMVAVGDTIVSPEAPEAARARMLVAPHEASLFDGTVAENLLPPGARADLRHEALHAAACDDVLRALPHGVDTVVGEGGLRLSGGQRQRVALARALMMDAPVLVLHEPTTAVDSVTESLISERLPRLRAGRTTVLLTTSPALLAACGRVVSPHAHEAERR